MQKKLKILGIVSVTIGVIASLLCLVPFGLFLSLPAGFIGMIFSCVYVFIDTKNNVNKKNITPGVIGVILNSLPILFVLIIIVTSHFKH